MENKEFENIATLLLIAANHSLSKNAEMSFDSFQKYHASLFLSMKKCDTEGKYEDHVESLRTLFKKITLCQTCIKCLYRYTMRTKLKEKLKNIGKRQKYERMRDYSENIEGMISENGRGRGYVHQEAINDIIEFSKKFPTIVFVLESVGNQYEDGREYRIYAINGKSERTQETRTFPPPNMEKLRSDEIQ